MTNLDMTLMRKRWLYKDADCKMAAYPRSSSLYAIRIDVPCWGQTRDSLHRHVTLVSSYRIYMHMDVELFDKIAYT